jgi:hypothetical protein
MASITRKTMPIEDLRREAVYLALTPKQKLLVETVIGNGGDKVRAVLGAFQYKNENSALKNSYAYFKNPRVVAVLNVWLKKTEKEIQLDIAEAQFRKAKAGSEPAFNFLNHSAKERNRRGRRCSPCSSS